MDVLFNENINLKNYFICEYYVESPISLMQAAIDIALGQSIGNPTIRNAFETNDLIENHACKILHSQENLSDKKKGILRIAFPIKNLSLEEDGISQILCMIQGGNTDINRINVCQVNKIHFPTNVETLFPQKAFGLSKSREYLNYYDKPLLGCIVKPKVGLNIKQYKSVISDLINNGANFIKEDEILSNPSLLPLELRVKAYNQVIGQKKVIFAFCINADPHSINSKIETILNNGGNAIHINFWSGLGSYHAIRRKFPNLFIFFQKSGVKTITHPQNPFAISWKVITKLARLSGIDAIHAGMIGGYGNDDHNEVLEICNELNKGDVLPSLSCGLHPGLVKILNDIVGVNYIANVGGAIYGHPGGHVAGVKAMRQAIDQTYGQEYQEAIKKWGLVEKL